MHVRPTSQQSAVVLHAPPKLSHPGACGETHKSRLPLFTHSKLPQQSVSATHLSNSSPQERVVRETRHTAQHIKKKSVARQECDRFVVWRANVMEKRKTKFERPPEKASIVPSNVVARLDCDVFRRMGTINASQVGRNSNWRVDRMIVEKTIEELIGS